MKELFVSFIMLFTITFNLSAQWAEIIPGPESLIDEISVVNDNVIWLKDQKDSTFSITLDGGSNWIKRNFPSQIKNYYPANICALSATTAFTVSISDLSDKVLRNETFIGNKKVIERDNLTPGFYILRIKGKYSNVNYSTKLILE